MTYNYQQFWDSYHDAAYYNPSQRHRFRLIRKEISLILGRKPEKDGPVRVLDMGCGMGHLIDILQKDHPALHFAGMDISVQAIEELRKRNPSATWIQADIQEPLDAGQDGGYDIVISSEVLEHCERFEKVLANIGRVTVPGGTVLITVPSGPRYRVDDDIGHLRHYNLEAVRNFYTGSGWTLRRSYRWGYPFLNLMRFTTDLFYPLVSKNFVNTRYSWRQKVFCQCLYLLMFVNLPRLGNQLVSVFDKS